jgi:hypothetical protein
VKSARQKRTAAVHFDLRQDDGGSEASRIVTDPLPAVK